jgi:hypothetical protein
MNGAPRRASSARTGRCTTSTSSSASMPATGEYEPMPPVFGPSSPSKARLKSCAAGSGTAFTPSQSAKTDTSVPSSSSSTTNISPSAATAGNAASSSSCVRQMKTPFPAASPSALTTQGARATDIASAVGTRAAPRTSFANAFEPSMRAASALGPNTEIPLWRSTSATPATRGASGPTTTRSTSSARDRLSSPSASSARIGWQSPSRPIPGFPGAQCSCARSELWASFHASACSRPPDPTTSTFTPQDPIRV